jgi:hypothetical protein
LKSAWRFTIKQVRAKGGFIFFKQKGNLASVEAYSWLMYFVASFCLHSIKLNISIVPSQSYYCVNKKNGSGNPAVSHFLKETIGVIQKRSSPIFEIIQCNSHRWILQISVGSSILKYSVNVFSSKHFEPGATCVTIFV